MYWRASRYPELSGRSASERHRIVIAAIENHGGKTTRRFFIAVGMVLGAAAVGGALLRHLASTDWRWWLLPISEGALFYAYLLWEINGPLHRAVAKQVMDQSAG